MKDDLADRIERSLTGVASCLTWRYEVSRSLRDREWGWSSNGDDLHINFFADESTGGNPPEPADAEFDWTIHGNFEAHEFLAVLERLTQDLRSVLGQPWDVYEEGVPKDKPHD